MYDAMKRNCADGVRLERVENAVNTGTPDVHGTRRGRTCWIELKVLRRPRRPATPLFKKKTMRKEQVAWHLSYASVGGRSVILVRDNLQQLYLFPGSMANVLHELTYSMCCKYSVASWEEFYMRAFD